MAAELKRIRLAVSAYDRAASWVLSLNILAGVAVALLLLFWLGQVMEFQGAQSTVVLVENVAGRGDHAAGFARDIEAPGIEELEEETQPQVEQLLEAVTEVVSLEAASLDTMQTTMFSSNTGSGLGDSRPPGPLGEGDDIIPRGERWEIQYNSNNLEAYARQLDYFRIELGVVGGGESQVDYAFQLSNARPSTRRGPGGESEKRLYMLWTSGALKQFDLQLLRAAGIRTAGRIVVQFYPQAVEDQLARIEMDFARRNGKTSVKQIKKTLFGVRGQGAAYEYFVVSQVYRAAPV
jgi:hypothetical protein